MKTPDYDTRTRMLEELGKNDPGVRSGKNDTLGLWAGIHHHTQWQRRTGRDTLKIWHLLNEQVTELPHRLSFDAKKDDNETVHVWSRYFRASRTIASLAHSKNPITRLTADLLARIFLPPFHWYAHNKALREAIKKYKKEFAEQSVSGTEKIFWRISLFLTRFGIFLPVPMTARYAKPLLGSYLPRHPPDKAKA